MSVRGYIENLISNRLVVVSLGLPLEVGQIEIIDSDDFLDPFILADWKQSVPELQILIDSGSIELRDSDDATIVTSELVSSWVDNNTVSVSSLPEGVLPITQYTNILTNKVQSDEVFLRTGDILVSESGFYIPYNVSVKYMTLTVDEADVDQPYELILYKNPTSPSRELILPVKLTLGILTRVAIYKNFDEALQLTPGEYGFALRKAGGDTSASAFQVGVAEIGVEIIP